MIWFTSDTHFGSERALELSKRPFGSVEAMDAIMINNWNSVVSSTDTVYHLGDFGNIFVVHELNGKIKLLPGNYEDDSKEDLEYLSLHCELIEPNSIIEEFQDLNIKLIHEPEEGNDKKAFYLFGHIHEKQKLKRNGLNVGVDVNNFTPINIDDVLFYKNGLDIEVFDDNDFQEIIK